ADTKVRRALLKKLCSTQRFEDYENQIDEKRSTLDKEAALLQNDFVGITQQLQELVVGTELCSEVAGSLHSLPAAEIVAKPPAEIANWLGQILLSGNLDLGACQSRVADSTTVLASARAELKRQESIARLQDKRLKALAVLAEVAELAPECAQWRAALEAHERSMRVRPTIRAAQQGSDIAQAAAQDLQAAKREMLELSPTVIGTDSERLVDAAVAQAARDQLVGDIKALAVALQQEAAIPGLKKRATAAAQGTQDRQGKRAKLLELVQQKTLAVAECEEIIATLGPVADLASQREAELTQAREGKAAVARYEEAKAKLLSAEKKAQNAAESQKAASTEVTRLWEARFGGYAGELAAELQPGKPCRVCGAVEHPAPAPRLPAGQQVTVAMVQNAQEAANRALALATDLGQAALKLTAEVAQLAVQAGGASTSEAEQAVELAAQRATESARAVSERNLQFATLEKLKTEIAAASQQAEILVGEIQNAISEQAAAAAQLAEAASQVGKSTCGFDTVAHRKDALERAESTIARYLTVTRRMTEAEANAKRTRDDCAAVLAEQRFESITEAQAARLSDESLNEMNVKLKLIVDREAAAQADLADPELLDVPPEPVDIVPAEAAVQRAEQVANTAKEQLGAAVERQKQINNLVTKAQELSAQGGQAFAKLTVVKRFSDTIRGLPPNERKMRLIDYVLAAELEQIVAAANQRLVTMKNGRYTLEYTDEKAKGNSQSGLGLQVVDAHTGRARPTQSLSGGEKFLASLALALGLAETVSNRAGGITLDTLFIDEGFGSLDDETLEIAMETLDSLRNNGRTVGVISHVGLMHERIPAKVEVTVTPGGWSEVSQT
ncbi:MAG: SMC family ATPase, partial [Cellulomonadaceae bacterium]|nr:SMC family ATPase [Cellulomonadaceae bacterium]